MSELEPWMKFALTVLATWRVTHLLAREDGPFDLVVRLRVHLGPGFFGNLLDCFYCLSLWVAAPLAWLLGHTWLERVLLVLALSAGAILLERITAEHREPENAARPDPTTAPQAIWHEEPLASDPREKA